jgi:nitrogen fixation NifU-like protein
MKSNEAIESPPAQAMQRYDAGMSPPLREDAGLDELYQEVILEHTRRPRNFRAIDGARKAEGDNPMCGDRLTVYVALERDAIIDASFQGTGCAICKASASMMTECVKGKTITEAHTLSDRLQRMLVTPPGAPVDQLGALTALAGVRQFPVRIKCATLAWQALRAALSG